VTSARVSTRQTAGTEVEADILGTARGH